MYATNPDWLRTLRPPERGSVYIMSEDGVFCATCTPGTLKDEDGRIIPVPENIEAIQRSLCFGASN